jgi:2-keto-3-deoxy-L-rhamnonate aldolase RhmA
MSIESAKERADQGMQFIAVGSDLKMMSERAKETVTALWPDRVAADIARY